MILEDEMELFFSAISTHRAITNVLQPDRASYISCAPPGRTSRAFQSPTSVDAKALLGVAATPPVGGIQ